MNRYFNVERLNKSWEPIMLGLASLEEAREEARFYAGIGRDLRRGWGSATPRTYPTRIVECQVIESFEAVTP